jgi:hypothetical protein
MKKIENSFEKVAFLLVHFLWPAKKMNNARCNELMILNLLKSKMKNPLHYLCLFVKANQSK